MIITSWSYCRKWHQSTCLQSKKSKKNETEAADSLVLSKSPYWIWTWNVNVHECYGMLWLTRNLPQKTPNQKQSRTVNGFWSEPQQRGTEPVLNLPLHRTCLQPSRQNSVTYLARCRVTVQMTWLVAALVAWVTTNKWNDSDLLPAAPPFRSGLSVHWVASSVFIWQTVQHQVRSSCSSIADKATRFGSNPPQEARRRVLMRWVGLRTKNGDKMQYGPFRLSKNF